MSIIDFKKYAWLVLGLSSFSMAMEMSSAFEQKPSHELQTITTLLPKDIWAEIASYVAGTIRFLNELSRQVELSDATYEAIARAHIESLDYCPNPEDIPNILSRNFAQTHKITLSKKAYQEKVEKALRKCILASVLMQLKKHLTDKNFDTIKNTILDYVPKAHVEPTESTIKSLYSSMNAEDNDKFQKDLKNTIRLIRSLLMSMRSSLKVKTLEKLQQGSRDACNSSRQLIEYLPFRHWRIFNYGPVEQLVIAPMLVVIMMRLLYFKGDFYAFWENSTTIYSLLIEGDLVSKLLGVEEFVTIAHPLLFLAHLISGGITGLIESRSVVPLCQWLSAVLTHLETFNERLNKVKEQEIARENNNE
jgi:hypothetical protein